MNKLEDAVEFVRSRTIEPLYAHPDAPQKLKDQTKHTEKVLRSFTRVGDLVGYMKRFKPDDGQKPAEQAVHDIGLLAFEDIHEEFLKRYAAYEHDRTRLSDFVVGESYSTWDLVNFAELYNTQTGGILLIGPDDGRRAIFLKATLDGSGDYPNEWLEPGKVLKYFMQGRKPKGASRKVFNETHKLNEAVIESGDTPLYAFDARDGQNTLVGLFRYDSHKKEPNGDMWFRLIKRDNFDVESLATAHEIQKELERKVGQSQTDSPESRRSRLKKAAKKPKKRQAITTSYDRNPDVVAEVLDRASGNCERCEFPAPFIKKSNNKPYLEVHHKITLANGGEDTVENAIALCPNCHRELHFGIGSE